MVITAKKTRKDSNLVSLVLCLVSCVLCLAQLTNTATAATYYLDPKGNDDANGLSVRTAWQTLSRAMTSWSGAGIKVTNGDTVKLRNGNYGAFSESDKVHTNWITYEAVTGHTPVFTSININRYPSHSTSYLRFNGITVVATANDVGACGVTRSDYVEFLNMRILGRGYTKGYSTSNNNGIGLRECNDITINNCYIGGAADGDTIFNGLTSLSGMDGSLFGRAFATGISVQEGYIHRNVTITDCNIISCNLGILVSDSNWLVYNNNISYLSSDGIDISHCNTAGSPSFGTTAPIIISHNHIHHLGQFSERAPNGEGLSGHNDLIQGKWAEQNHVIIRDNIMHDSDQQGIFWRTLKTAHSHDWLFENNLIYRCNLGINQSNYAVRIYSGTDITFRNNTIAGDNQTGGMMLTENESGQARWTNFSGNIIPAIDLYTDGNNGTVFDYENYNIINSTWIHMNSHVLGNHTIVLNNLTAYKALFKNYDANDFSLSANSLAIDLGNAAYAPISDILGHSRDSSPDAGCYEYMGTAPPPSKSPPNADAGRDQSGTSGQITLDGSNSSDSDGNIVSYVWTEKGNQIATGVSPTVTLSPGRHIITLTVTDNDGLTATDTVTVIVELEAGLRGYYKFDEGSGTTASDFAQISATGRLVNGPTWTNQGEIRFAGGNDAVEISTADMKADEGTIALWAYPEVFSKNKHSLFGHTLSGGNKIQLYCDASGALSLGLGDSASLETGIQTLSTQEWYHIALSWDGAAYAVYVDGVQKAAGTYGGLSNLQTYADIGNNGNRSSRTEGFNGLIDEVRLYNKPLSADEINDLALVFLPIGDKTVAEGEELSFPIRTKSNVIVELSDQNLPSIPTFASNTFRWTPDYDDAGTYEVEFSAQHGSGEDFEKVTVTVLDTQQEEPIGYWNFDETNGEIASDSSSSGNNGSLKNGLAWVSGKTNGAIEFSVPNDAVEIQTTNFNPKSGTIAMWVNVTGQTLSRHYLFGHASQALTNRIQLYLKYGQLCLGLGDSHETRTDIQLLENQIWYHIALTWSPTTYNIYINGSLMASDTYAGLTELTGHADIGNNGISRDKALNGKIDDVRIYNRALNVNEISQLVIGG